MHASFDFDAPRNYNFFATNNKKSQNEFCLNVNDSNDRWFMRPQPSDHKQDETVSPIQFDVKPQTYYYEPIKREKLPPMFQALTNSPSIYSLMKRLSASEKEDLEKAWVQIMKERQQIEKEDRKMKAITKRRKAVTKALFSETAGAVNNLKRHKRPTVQKIDKPKQLRIHTDNERNLSLDDKKPCPFAPRYQREWQSIHRKEWYSLSPDSKLEAEKSMVKLKQKNLKKEYNIESSHPFKF